jgi:dipeptidyl aminopeptidase/acylaminoacyl peptidase
MKMKKQFLFVNALIVLTILISSCTNMTKTEIEKAPILPLEDFFKNPEKTGYQISPDGKYFSYLAPFESRLNVFIQEIGGDTAIRITSETERDIRRYFWANNERILFLKDKGGDENFMLFGVNIDGSNFKGLTEFDGVMTDIIDDLEDIPSEVIVGLNKRIPQIFDPYRLNIETGELTMLAENPGNIQGWMTDHNGRLRAAYTVDGTNSSLLYREAENEEFKAVLTTTFKESINPMFFTFDNKKIYATSNLGRDKAAAVIFDIANGKEEKVVYENEDYDVDRITYSRKRKTLTAAMYQSWKSERYFFDDLYKEVVTDLESKLPGVYVAITGRTKEEEKWMIRTYSDKTLGDYYVYTVETKELTHIHEVSPWLKAENMAEQKPIQYQSRDGLTINGYLTLPKGYTMETAKNLPVVVNPHGGPWARDSWGFNPEIQFLANRGYAVLQMNFRGSTGYGRKFWEASFGQWGLKMQDDITDGVNWIIEIGIADPKRIAIYGGSYGGYATLAGLTYTPELYACGVDYVGVSNLFTFFESFPPYWEPFKEMMYEMVGHPEEDSVQLAETSPALNADKIVVPLYIAQGANDPRVKKAESDQMVEAMKARGVEVEYLVKDNEGHGFHNEENQFEFYGAMEKFLNTHIGNGVEK